MIAYKFLRAGAVGRLSGFSWPLPVGGRPGRWVVANGETRVSSNGIHACRARDLPAWIDDELWIVELGGHALERGDVLVAGRGRLLGQVRGWGARTALAFAHECVCRARDQAVRGLTRAGLADDAAELARAQDPEAIAQLAAERAAGPAPAAQVAAFAADVACLAAGRRPDAWITGSAADPRQAPGATAANLGFVVAHGAGLEAVRERGEAAYGDGFDAERGGQAAWLAARLGLAFD